MNHTGMSQEILSCGHGDTGPEGSEQVPGAQPSRCGHVAAPQAIFPHAGTSAASPETGPSWLDPGGCSLLPEALEPWLGPCCPLSSPTASISAA